MGIFENLNMAANEKEVGKKREIVDAEIMRAKNIIAQRGGFKDFDEYSKNDFTNSVATTPVQQQLARLDKLDIENMINDANKYAELDKLAKEKIEARNCLDNYISSLKRTIETSEYKIKLGDNKYKEIYLKLMEYDEWLEEADSSNTINGDQYKNKYKELEDYIIPLLKDIYN
jgi:molecular chaperone DnaK (HSP70)